jgi:hypothetical protein
MTSQTHPVQPPRIAVWLLDLFAPAEKSESILGDLLEEFSILASKSGEAFAQRWFWWQTIRTVPRLVRFGVRTAPWLTSAAVAGGFLLRKLLAPLVGPAIFAVLERYQVFEHHFGTYRFFASTGIDIGHLITFLFIGFAVALVSRQREIVVTTALGLIYGIMAVVGSVYLVIRTGDSASLWRLTWYFADSFAIVIAGAIVRTRRLAATSRRPTA